MAASFFGPVLLVVQSVSGPETFLDMKESVSLLMLENNELAEA